MAKQDVLDAINATIVENGQKGITAQALNNVLTMMTENAGEGGGSGDGVLRIMVPTVLCSEPTLFTPEYWDTMKEYMDAELPGISDALQPVISEMFTHNATVYQQLLEKGSKEEGVLCLLDSSKILSVLASYTLSSIEGTTVQLHMLSSEIARAVVNIAKTDVERAEVNIIAVDPAPENDYSLELGSAMDIFGGISLNSDGSMTLYPKYTTIYVPSSEEETLPDEYKSMNAIVSEDISRVTVIKFVSSTGGTFLVQGNVLARDASNNILFYAVTNALSVDAGALAIYKVTISSDGSVTNTLVSNLVSA